MYNAIGITNQPHTLFSSKKVLRSGEDKWITLLPEFVNKDFRALFVDRSGRLFCCEDGECMLMPVSLSDSRVKVVADPAVIAVGIDLELMKLIIGKRAEKKDTFAKGDMFITDLFFDGPYYPFCCFGGAPTIACTARYLG